MGYVRGGGMSSYKISHRTPEKRCPNQRDQDLPHLYLPTLQWILEILHDPKYLMLWVLWQYCIGHEGSLGSTVPQVASLFLPAAQMQQRGPQNHMPTAPGQLAGKEVNP